MPPPRQAHWGSRIEEVHSTERAAFQPPFLLVQILQRWTQIDPPSTVYSLSRLRGGVREGALSTADSVHVAGRPPRAPPPRRAKLRLARRAAGKHEADLAPGLRISKTKKFPPPVAPLDIGGD